MIKTFLAIVSLLLPALGFAQQTEIAVRTPAGGVKLAPGDANGYLGTFAASHGVVVYDSGTTCNAGAACNSGVLDLTAFSSCLVVAYNADGAAARNLGSTVYLDDGTTAIFTSASLFSVTAASTLLYVFGHSATTATGTAGVWTLTLPTKMKFTLAAGGSSAGRLTAICR